MTTRRRLTGWPPGTAQGAHGASASEQSRARQTGKTVHELRNEEARAEAATVLMELLDDDKSGRVSVDTADGDVLTCLPVKTRWALHVAVGVLRGAAAKDGVQ